MADGVLCDYQLPVRFTRSLTRSVSTRSVRDVGSDLGDQLRCRTSAGHRFPNLLNYAFNAPLRAALKRRCWLCSRASSICFASSNPSDMAQYVCRTSRPAEAIRPSAPSRGREQRELLLQNRKWRRRRRPIAALAVSAGSACRSVDRWLRGSIIGNKTRDDSDPPRLPRSPGSSPLSWIASSH